MTDQNFSIAKLLGLFTLITISVIAGALIIDNPEDSTRQQSAAGYQADNQRDDYRLEPTIAGPTESVNQQLASLREEIVALNNRIKQLEQQQSGNTRALGNVVESVDIDRQTPTAFSSESNNRSNLIINGLVSAGVDTFTAEEIVRKQNATQLARLELQDKAMREGYMGTPQFREEMRELRAQESGLRENLDDSTYDRFLYHTGQPNRVGIDSVMLGSAAEQTGLQAGDVIVSYQDEKMYSFRDLRGATVSGERNETVSITVLREGNEMLFSIPRGPLGVQLNSIRLDPDSGDS